MSEHEDHGTVLAEPDHTRHNTVAALIGLLAITLAVTAYSLWSYFVRASEAITHEVVLSLQSPELQALRAKEQAELGGAAIADEAYHLPVSEAASLLVREVQSRKQAGEAQRIEALAAASAEESETP